MEVDDGLAAGGGFEEGEVLGVVVEKVLGKGAGAKGVLQDGEVGFPVGIAGGLATGGVTAPASGGHPLPTFACSVGVDGNQADILLAQLPAPGVGSLDAGAEGDVVVFGDEEVGIVAGVFQLPDDGGGDLPGVAPFVVAAVRGAFAGGVERIVPSVRMWICLVEKGVSCLYSTI